AAKARAAARPLEDHAAVSVALPDSGVFAPVAAQYRARMALARRTAAGRGDIVSGEALRERIEALLDTGQPDAAASLVSRSREALRTQLNVRARTLLARQDFAAARPLIERLRALPSPDAGARRQIYAWLFACDDAATIDSLSRRRIAADP